MLFLKVHSKILFSAPVTACAKGGKTLWVAKEGVILGLVIEGYLLLFEAAEENFAENVHF